jgi:hypothetical protein
MEVDALLRFVLVTPNVRTEKNSTPDGDTGVTYEDGVLAVVKNEANLFGCLSPLRLCLVAVQEEALQTFWLGSIFSFCICMISGMFMPSCPLYINFSANVGGQIISGRPKSSLSFG